MCGIVQRAGHRNARKAVKREPRGGARRQRGTHPLHCSMSIVWPFASCIIVIDRMPACGAHFSMPRSVARCMCYAPFVTRSRLCLRQMGPARLCFAPPLSVRCPVCFRRFRRDPHGPFVSGARWLRSSCGFVLSRLCSIVTFIFRSLGGPVCE